VTDGAGLTLREAIALAEATGNEVTNITVAGELAGGTLTLTHGELLISEALTIDGDLDGDGRADITIDANEASRALRIDGVAVTLEGLIVQDGAITSGDGGNILAEAGSELTLLNARVIDGDAGTGSGGGLALIQSDFTATGTTIAGNRAASAGGIEFAGSANTLTLESSTVSDNRATERGGLAATDATVEIVNSTIAGNLDDIRVGGIALTGSDLTLTNATVTANASGSTAGIEADATSSIRLENSIVAGNASGIRTPQIVNAGSISYAGGNVVGENVLDGDQVQFQAAIDLLFAETSELVDIGGNLTAVQGGVLEDNGGPVETVALFRQGASVDRGDQSLLPPGITTDANGAARIFGNGLDLGAFESQEPDTPGVVTRDGFLISEDSGPATGSISVVDPDPFDVTSFANAVGVALDQDIGDLVVNAAGDTTTFTLDNALVQDLDAGEEATFRYRLTADDGITTTNLAVRVRGSDDGGDGDESLNGSIFTDFIDGGLGDDTIFGGDGDDTLQGGLGADQLNGDGGSDTASYGDSAEGILVSFQASLA
ncbi:MAG: choice-of-anchor Q domain-containing protein, partial [Pseudomonadota bacterium]